MIKVIIVSGFLGSGKTTLIKKILNNQQQLKKVMLLENEFGEIGIDGQILKNSIQVKEINSGCICCSLNGKLEDSLNEIAKYDIDTLIIEPSGVAKLSEIKKLFKNSQDFQLLNSVTMVDVTKAEKYHKNFKDFYEDQISNTDVIILSRSDIADAKQTKQIMQLCEHINNIAVIVTTPIHQLSDKFIFEMIDDVIEINHQCECGCDCHHHLDDNNNHSHHNCCCHHGGENHHHKENDHPFSSCGFQTPKKFNLTNINQILNSFDDNILRAKGIVQLENEEWIHFEYTPDEIFTEKCDAHYSGLISIIGTNLNEKTIKELFDVKD